ncbi:hypothetical protein [Streptomyces sp. NPDC059949]|uniref:hypothetical protein n=1 Tax=Streptomyces sp. NPDC059949 TaxID=3347013 RepID=UPI0036473E0F
MKAMDALRTAQQKPLPIAEPAADPPAFVIRAKILGSLAEAERAWRARSAEQCLTYADWEAVCDARESGRW